MRIFRSGQVFTDLGTGTDVNPDLNMFKDADPVESGSAALKRSSYLRFIGQKFT